MRKKIAISELRRDMILVLANDKTSKVLNIYVHGGDRVQIQTEESSSTTTEPEVWIEVPDAPVPDENTVNRYRQSDHQLRVEMVQELKINLRQTMKDSDINGAYQVMVTMDACLAIEDVDGVVEEIKVYERTDYIIRAGDESMVISVPEGDHTMIQIFDSSMKALVGIDLIDTEDQPDTLEMGYWPDGEEWKVVLSVVPADLPDAP